MEAKVETAEKKKVLVLSDSSCGFTGFSTVAYNILKDISDTGLYEILQVGINYDGCGYNLARIPYRIIPATSGMEAKYRDVYGRARFLDILRSSSVEIVFILQDMQVVASFMDDMQEIYNKLPKGRKFTTIFYTPVDSSLLTKRDWVINSVSKIDYPVVYTEYGKKEMIQFDPDLKKRLRVCPHGVDTANFYPMAKEEIELAKKTIFKDVNFSGKFIILNLNRNQIRKDYLKTFKTLAELKKIVPNALLIAFAARKDQGGDLTDIARQCGLEPGKDWVGPPNYDATHGIPVDAVNAVYNISDCVFSSTVGEGWGLSSIEGMSCKKPCVFPDNTSLTEIFGGDGIRGRLVKSGDTPDNFVCYGVNDSSLVRPTISVQDAVEKLAWVAKGGPAVDEMAKRGYIWTRDMDWRTVNNFWIDLFAKASERTGRIRGSE
jgi:D-inositol-3-phosphate glycosyltransferase